VTFELFKGTNCDPANKVGSTLSATPASVTANGTFTSQNYDTTTSGAGSYHWIAHYSGDANNKAADGACLDNGENTTVEKFTPTLSTSATQSAVVGQNISDVATLSGLVSPTGAGAVTFDVYKGADCSGTKLATLSATPASVTANGTFTSQNFDTTNSGAGAYHWIAHYSGDANNKAADGACLANGENTTVEKATPGLSTNATQSATVGQSIQDVATLSGLVKATGAGAVTFDLYKGTDCSGTKLATLSATPASVTANGNFTSQSFDTTTSGAGSYHWIAHYSGDANNKAADGACLADNENTAVGKITPALATTAGPGTTLGGRVTDTAHLSGGVNPTGTITFVLYDNPNCSGTPAATVANGAINGNGDYSSPPVTPTAVGEYHWVASYSGDANNEPVQNGCSDESEKVTITQPPVQEVEPIKSNEPPPVCKLRKARARVFIYTRHNRVRLVIRYVAYTRAKVTTSYTLHGRKGGLFLGKATQTFKKKSVFRLPKTLTPKKMKKVRAATEFDVQFQIPGTPEFCQAYFKRKLTIARFVEGQKVWFQTGSVFGGDV
jgi:hypothetical protein